MPGRFQVRAGFSYLAGACGVCVCVFPLTTLNRSNGSDWQPLVENGTLAAMTESLNWRPLHLWARSPELLRVTGTNLMI